MRRYETDFHTRPIACTNPPSRVRLECHERLDPNAVVHMTQARIARGLRRIARGIAVAAAWYAAASRSCLAQTSPPDRTPVPPAAAPAGALPFDLAFDTVLGMVSGGAASKLGAVRTAPGATLRTKVLGQVPKGLKIGLFETNLFGMGVHPECLEAVQKAHEAALASGEVRE